jgi:oxygen-independent coproporphyrinogen-3 oxidase
MNQFPSYEETMAMADSAILRLDAASLRDAGLARDPLDYYLIATYPPLKAMDDITSDEVFRDAGPDHRVYVHVPFCEQYCTFCHYLKEINPKQDRVLRYLRALHRDIDITTARFANGLTARSIYYGGGTPSYLLPCQLDELLGHLHRSVTLPKDSEVIFELHPGVVRQPDYEERIRVLKAHGVRRYVFGIQSMDEAVLEKINRGHGRAEVFRMLDVLATHGCDDFSIDLIFGMPYQTTENWYATLRDLVDAGVQKFDIYPLMLKMTDPISTHYEREPEIFPTREERTRMQFMAEQMLYSLGYTKAPIGHYSRGSYRYAPVETLPRYLRVEGAGLVPFGVSGFGYVGHTQYYNYCSMKQYHDALEAGGSPVWRGVTLSLDERMRRVLMFSLRSRGLVLADFEECFGRLPQQAFPHEFARLDAAGLIRVDDGVLRLSPRGEAGATHVVSTFASNDVIERVRATNRQLGPQRRGVLERFNYSPIDHVAPRVAGTHA